MAKNRKSKAIKDQSTLEFDQKANTKMLRNEALRQRIATHIKSVRGKEGEWRKEAKEDIAFYRGNQWDPAERRELDKQGRPCLTFNELKPLIDVIQGYFRRNSGRIRVNPIGGEDTIFAEVFDRAIKAIDRKSKLEFKLGYVFDCGVTCGKDYLEMVRTFEEDPVFGHLRFVDLGPWKVYVDPNSTEYDLSDAGWVIKEGKFTKAKLIAMYPSAKARIESIAKDECDETPNFTEAVVMEIVSESDEDNYDNEGLNPPGVFTSYDEPLDDKKEGEDKTLTTFVEYSRINKKQWFVYYVERGTFDMFDDEDKAKEAAKKDEDQRRQSEAMALASERVDTSTAEGVLQATNFADQLLSSKDVTKAVPIEPNKIEAREVPVMHVTVMVGGHILIHDKSPLLPEYNGFPIFRYIADWFPHAEEEKDRVHGFIRQAKDAQRELNKARSSNLHIIATGANSGWIVDDDMDKDMRKKLESFGSMPGLVVVKPKGSSAERITAVPAPVAQITRENLASESVKKVTGINADLMGSQDSKSDSGRQMALRIRQAILVLEKAFQNFRYTKELIGRAVFKVVPSLFNASKLRRVLGEQFMQENQLELGHLKAFLQLVRDGEFDLTITDSEDSETIREETFDALLKMAEKGLPIPPDVLIEFAPISNKKEIQRRIQEFAQAQAQAAQQK